MSDISGKHCLSLIPHATATSALGQINGRQDFIEVSMDLTRLVEALGPDILFGNSQAPPLDGRVEFPKQQVTGNRWTASDH